MKNKRADKLRTVTLECNFPSYASGSVLIRQGNTWVLCTACIEEKAPPFLRDTGKGWITAEYGMLPSSTGERKEREVKKGKPDARGTEMGTELEGEADHYRRPLP